MSQGSLIAMEGVDGSGKTTQARLLAEALQTRGRQVVLTQEPSPGPTGQKLRQYLQGPERYLTPHQELELFIADRREHLHQVILPALERAYLVVTDRYFYSTAAYQGALGIDPAWILAENRAFAPEPHLVFLLVLPPSVGLARRTKVRTEPRQVSETLEYLEKVASIYEQLQGPNLHRLDGNLPLEEVQSRILELTLKSLSGN
jgi:dTMP kinase